MRDSGAYRLRRRANRVLLGRLVAQLAPGPYGAQPHDAQDVRARFDGVDTASWFRLVHPRLHLASGAPLPPREIAQPRGDRRARDRARRASGRGDHRMNSYVEAGYAVVLGTLGAY